MISKASEQIFIRDYCGEAETILSNGIKIVQSFTWDVVDDEGKLEICTAECADELEIIGAADSEETEAELYTIIDTCLFDKSDIEEAIMTSGNYKEAEAEYKERKDLYSYYGVSRKDFY